MIGRYDAAEWYGSISIAWAIILVLAAMSVVTVAGMSKLPGGKCWMVAPTYTRDNADAVMASYFVNMITNHNHSRMELLN